MLNKLLSYLTLGGVVLLIALQLLGGSQAALGGTTNYDQLDTTDGYSVDGTSIINESGAFVGVVNGTTLQLDSGTTINELTCTTATWNPPSFSSSSVASTSIAIAGIAVGDIMWASLDSATSTDDWYVTANVRNAGSSTAFLVAAEGSGSWNAGLNLTTSTLRVCQLGF